MICIKRGFKIISTKKTQKIPAKLIVLQSIKMILFFVLIFWLAGRLNYWQGWLFTIYLASLVGCAFYFFRNCMNLFQERIRHGSGIKWWDRIFLTLIVILNCVILIISILDSGRYAWTGRVAPGIYVMGYLGLTGASALMFWAMYENRFLFSVVRIQKERKQKVCTKGPYIYLRHPGYSAGILMGLCIPAALGSFVALLPGLALAAVLIMRTYLEDITLQKELKGYKHYVSQVPYRLLPGAW